MFLVEFSCYRDYNIIIVKILIESYDFLDSDARVYVQPRRVNTDWIKSFSCIGEFGIKRDE